ncbi:MAG TPA: tetratricopeptide repeat protein [Planctomycetota bacterium]
MIASAPDPTTALASPPPVPASSPPLWPTLASMLGLALVVYLPAAFGASFLDFDDNFFFGPDNPEFREGLAAVWCPGRPIANAWLPVAHSSLWFDWACCGGRPFWPHVHSLLLHGLAATALVRLLLACGAQRTVAWLAGACFLVHPALAESVAWVSGRKDLLSGLFVFLALLQTVRFAQRPGLLRALALAVLAALAMYSKATAVVLPLLAALVCVHVGGAPRRFLGPLVLLLVTMPIAWHHQAIAAEEGTLGTGPIGDRLLQFPGVCAHYVATAFWPLHLNVLHPEVDTLARFRAEPFGGLSTLAGALLAVAAAIWRPAWRPAAVAIASFFAALLPFNTVYPASAIAVADRYLYLAVPAAALLVVMLLHRTLQKAGLAVAAGLVALLAVGACSRAFDFRSDEALWRSSLEVESVNAVAHLNLVYERLQRGAVAVPAAFEEVQQHLEAAVAAARYPIHELRARQLLVRLATRRADYQAAAKHARAAIEAARAQLARETSPRRLGQATALLLQAQLAAFEPLQQVGDDAGAQAIYTAAKEQAPDHPDLIAFASMRELAAIVPELLAAAAAGRPVHLADGDARAVSALRTLQQALERHPKHSGLLCAMASWERVCNRALPALRHYRQAQEADPDCIEAWLGAARLLRESENNAEAERYARQGLEQRPDPRLRQELALALVGQGRLDDAILQLEAYLRVVPDDKDSAKVLANLLIGRAYSRLGTGSDHADVLAIVERALAYNPQEGKAHLVLGRMKLEQRHFPEAVKELEQAHRLMPDFEEGRTLLADATARLGYDCLLRADDEAAADAWLRCVAVAPADFSTEAIQQQLERIWQRAEARGVEARKAGDREKAIREFRRCLRVDPAQHWAAWLLAVTMQEDPAADLAELEQLCRKAVAWQAKHGLERSEQVYLLATTLVRAGKQADAKAVAEDYLRTPESGSKPQVLAALQRLRDSGN